ncbi:fructose-bisphosphate aldolase class I [Candidatus Saccharibacteria bacterium]|nr:fructose-bisphosphate aldolase class I [Candidatus Saccharibacteria bacterium]
MSRIVIFGNVIKDVYLDMNGEKSERDEDDVEWMDIGFNGGSHFYAERTAMLGGAKVTQEVLRELGVESEIMGGETAKEYRYILCKNDKISYFVDRKKAATEFITPASDAQIIIVDRSAGITKTFVEALLNYKKQNRRAIIIYSAKNPTNEAEKRLAKEADLLFANFVVAGRKDGQNCWLDKDGMKVGKKSVKWKLERAEMMTHLTVYSVAMATMLAAVIKGKSAGEALLFAKANVENSKLNRSLNFEKLEEIVKMERSGALDLREMAKMLVSGGKGILAADESGGSIHKKFEGMGIVDDEEHRRNYRNIFFTTPGLEKYVNGVILFDETARQRADDGRTFTEFLTGLGIVPGIKVDQGLVDFPNSEEKWTQGLDGLDERLAEYYQMGLRFAKWRAAFTIDEKTPSEMAIEKNAEILAEYAKKCQEAKIVPIVEPEVVYDGNYSLEKSKEVTGKVLRVLFEKLREREVDLAGTILKVNMVIAGKQFFLPSTEEEVGRTTAETLREFVPEELAGVVFLSGGQTVEQATKNLQAVANNGPFPWPVTFSFARALQEPALVAWHGSEDAKDIEEAKARFLERLIANCEALKLN